MNKLKTLLLITALVGFISGAQAATNSVSTNTAPVLTPEVTNSMPMELTLGGAGVTSPRNGETSFGFNTTLSIQPLKQPIWFGIGQSLSWEPSFSGETDFYSDWVWTIFKDKLYLNTGWNVGALYDRHTLGWQSGPEVEFEYYTSGNAFIFLGASYGLVTKTESGWQTFKSSNNISFNFGIGMTL